jgi:hypothetical protein
MDTAMIRIPVVPQLPAPTVLSPEKEPPVLIHPLAIRVDFSNIMPRLWGLSESK